MIWLQISANTGPAECCRAVVLALSTIAREAQDCNIRIAVLEDIPGPLAGTSKSILLELDDSSAPGSARLFTEKWKGSIQWIWESKYRAGHKRKNWFINCSTFSPPADVDIGEIVFEATRASGPGGQHVNKTDSAIRATHVLSGISVKVQTERSQHANKKIARQLIIKKLEVAAATSREKGKSERRMDHHNAERGNPSRTFYGDRFVERI